MDWINFMCFWVGLLGQQCLLFTMYSREWRRRWDGSHNLSRPTSGHHNRISTKLNIITPVVR